jgi:hypothetical protein
MTLDKGIFSYSVDIRILSNFSNMGFNKEFAHVKLLPNISNSLRFSPSITELNKKRPTMLEDIIILLPRVSKDIKIPIDEDRHMLMTTHLNKFS